MEVKTITQTVIEASEGYILTNGDAFGKTVSLGVGDNVENWWEITEEEYQKVMEEKRQEEVPDGADSI